jgi:hypothetical protein
MPAAVGDVGGEGEALRLHRACVLLWPHGSVEGGFWPPGCAHQRPWRPRHRRPHAMVVRRGQRGVREVRRCKGKEVAVAVGRVEEQGGCPRQQRPDD